MVHVMSEVKRYIVSWHMQELYLRPDGDVVRFSDHSAALDAQRLRADTAEALAAERLAAWEKCAEFRDAAEQSISDLSSLLREGIQTVERLSTTPKDYNEEQWVDLHAWTFNVDAALNPNPEAESHE